MKHLSTRQLVGEYNYLSQIPKSILKTIVLGILAIFVPKLLKLFAWKKSKGRKSLTNFRY